MLYVKRGDWLNQIRKRKDTKAEHRAPNGAIEVDYLLPGLDLPRIVVPGAHICRLLVHIVVVHVGLLLEQVERHHRNGPLRKCRPDHDVQTVLFIIRAAIIVSAFLVVRVATVSIS